MQRRFQTLTPRLADSLISNLRIAAREMGLSNGAIRRLLMEIRREEDMLRHISIDEYARMRSLSDYA